MKTSAITFAAIVVLALGTVNLSKAVTKTNDSAVVLNNVSKINKIEIHGNVQVFVSGGTSDCVKVYNKYYSENALVQNENGVLRISSYTKDKLVVWVTANDLRSISAYDNAEVKSFGKLSVINLDVNLYNTSKATLDLDSYSASIYVNDRAKINLSGTLDACDLQYSNETTVNQSALQAGTINSVKQFLKPVEQNNATELAIL